MSVVLEYVDIKGFKKEIEKIGSGSYSNVFIAKSTRDKKFYALKRINDDSINRKSLESQFDILKQLDHPNITKFYDVHVDKLANIYIQMELCKNNLVSFLNLKPKINLKKRGLNDVEYIVCYKIFREILAGVNYLHNKKIIHRDLKPANILVNYRGDNNNFIKISDFGNSIIHTTGLTHTELQGTPNYMAPEVLHSREYNLKADIYSLGKIGDELFSCDTSVEPEINREESYKINLISLLVSMVDGMPGKRPDCVAVLQMFETCLIDIDKSIIKKIYKKAQYNNIKYHEFFINILKVELDNLSKSANLPNPQDNIIQASSSKHPGTTN